MIAGIYYMLFFFCVLVVQAATPHTFVWYLCTVGWAIFPILMWEEGRRTGSLSNDPRSNR